MEHIVRTELAYYRNIHKSEMVATSNLFKLNSVSHEERLMKLCLLIDGPNKKSITNICGNKDALKVIKNGDLLDVGDTEIVLQVKQICITLWNDRNGIQLYVGYCKEVKSDSTFVVQYLERVNDNENMKWKYPNLIDT